MNGIYLSLGSNLGNRLNNLREAVNQLESHGIKTLEESTIYETEPWGMAEQGWFLNMIIEIEISLNPEKLLQNLLEIEQKMGRERKEKWGERIIDLDILYYNELIVEKEELVLPHSGIPDRNFILNPMTELNPFGIHPVLKKNQMEMLASCKDTLACNTTDFKL